MKSWKLFEKHEEVSSLIQIYFDDNPIRNLEEVPPFIPSIKTVEYIKSDPVILFDLFKISYQVLKCVVRKELEI
jgi:hypothetical protein